VRDTCQNPVRRREIELVKESGAGKTQIASECAVAS